MPAILVKTTLESRSDLVLVGVAHPAAAQNAPQVAGYLTHESHRSTLPLLHRQVFEFFCVLLI